MGDAAEHPKQIEWVETASYITALDYALCQRVDRSPDPTVNIYL
jgi:hypothetical protein